MTLSACDTGTGMSTGDGREVESFGALAQKRGARSVLASLWRVADASTARLMQHFYSAQTAGGLGKAMALREAQLSLIREGRESRSGKGDSRGAVHKKKKQEAPADWSHPYYWAPFFLMGNWQ